MIIGLQNIEKSYGYLHKPTDFEKEHLPYLHGMGYNINEPEFYYNRKSFPDFVVMYYTNEKLSSIAGALGFYDSNHFSLCFSKIVGVSPSKYRRNSRE